MERVFLVTVCFYTCVSFGAAGSIYLIRLLFSPRGFDVIRIVLIQPPSSWLVKG